MDALNRSIGIDFRLWPHDVRLSQAWAEALGDAGVLSPEDCRTIVRGLDVVAERLGRGVAPIASDEDIHTLIDRLLHEEIGEPASRLHTGRSRNDQVATASRLWAMECADAMIGAAAALQATMLERCADLDGAIMPSYTHLQRAQPVAAAHWLLSHFWPLQRDRQRLIAARQSASALALGAGAVAGSAFPVSRERLRAALGFERISENSIDTVGDRDFIADLLYAFAMIGIHLSRFAEDLIMYGSSEFGFVRFGHTYTTGSSMMPQKRNPDALELARGSGARLLGDLTSLLVTLKGLPSSYSKDLQDDKRALFDAADTLMLVLPAVRGTLAELTFNRERMRAAVSSTMMATDLADYLVRKGLPFREAHAAVGRIVRAADERSVELHELSLDEFRKSHSLFDSGVYDALSAEGSVARRGAYGGTAPDALRVQLENARKALG
jgi:argininosuccinate lyase